VILHGSIRWARVDRLYTQGGHVVADVTDRWGGVYRAVRFLGLGGGAGNFAGAGGKAPPAEDTSELPTDGEAAEVALVFPEPPSGSRGAAQRPWIIASAMHPDDGVQITVEESAPDPAEDYTAHHVTDHVIQRKGGRVVVSELAGLLLQGLPGQPVRMQLQGEDTFRLSSDGEAGESILLGGKLREYLNGLAAQVESIRQAVITLENFAGSGEPHPGGATLFPDFQAWVAARIADGGELAPAEAFAGTADTIESAVVQISSKSKGD